QEASYLQPTLGNIYNVLSELKRSVPRDGLFLFAFSGHGVELDVEGKGARQNYLLPKGAAHNDDDPNVVRRSSVDLETIKRDIKERGIKQVIMLIDSCRENPTKGGKSVGANNLASESYLNRFNFDDRNSAIEAFVILLASSAGQRAWEYEKEKMGFFTWAIVQAMACEGEGGEACNEKGELTLGRLIGFLQEKLPAKVREVIGKEQKPKVEISDSYKADDLVLSAAPRLAGSKAVAGAPAIISRELPELEEPRNWGYAERGNTPGDYRYYLRLFPNGPHADEA